MIPGINRLAEEPWPVYLAISLHAADDELRTSLVPINKRYPIADLERDRARPLAGIHRTLEVHELANELDHLLMGKAAATVNVEQALLFVVLALALSRALLSVVGVIKGRLSSLIGSGVTCNLRKKMVEKLQSTIESRMAMLDHGRMREADSEGETRTRQVERFTREALAAARLRHPNVCPVYDSGEIPLGASIACCGACMTVVEKGPGWFAIDVSAESLARTTLGSWEAGRRVNLEIETGSELTMGMSVVDWWGVTDRTPNCLFIRDIDDDGFLRLLTQRLATL